MDHNTYAVPFSNITKPKQFFSAYYKIYIGDSLGNDIAPTASTTTTWGWEGPAFVFTSQTGVATSTLVESDVYIHTGGNGSISITGGDYAISTDGGTTWGAWVTPADPAGTINTSNRVKVRQTSSAIPGTDYDRHPGHPHGVRPGNIQGHHPWSGHDPDGLQLQQPDRRSCQYVH